MNVLGSAGSALGGMAARVAVLEETPVAMTGCVRAHSASAVFTEGILKNYLAWEVLNRELDGGGSAIALMRWHSSCGPTSSAIDPRHAPVEIFKKGGQKPPLCISCPCGPDRHENAIPDDRNP